MSETRTLSVQQPVVEDAWLWTVQVLFCGEAILDTPPVPVASEMQIGRSPKGRTDLTLDDGRVSRHHATLRRRGDNLSVKDAGSHNGTVVNGLRVERAQLSDGDRIRIGDSVLLVRKTPLNATDAPLEGLIGQSVAMRQLRARLTQVGKASAPVLLIGESGAGKGASVQALHRASGRRGPLVSLNCAAIPETLAESTLFGHRAGAFTGATRDEPGLLRSAEHGTAFLDEIGDMPLALQPKLLRFLDDGEVRPVGTSTAHKTDVRVVAATNVDLAQAQQAGTFRGDLYARLAALVVRVPPLRERREDVLALMAPRLEGGPPLTANLAEALVNHDWPYNVREAKQISEELAVLGADHERLTLPLLAHRLVPRATEAPPSTSVTPDAETLAALLREHQGVVTQVARALGRSTKQVYRWAAKYGLNPDDYRS